MHHVFVQKDNDRTIRVEQSNEGEITVTTTVNENGQETTTTKTYANADELKAADPDAHKLLDHCPNFSFDMMGPGGQFDIRLPDDVHLHIAEALKGSEDALKMSEESMRMLEEHMKTLGGPGGPQVMFLRKARTSFDVAPDGKIKVITRDGEDELIENYDNADALKAARPDLYKKFEKLQPSGETTPPAGR
jgi:hypothetical protein